MKRVLALCLVLVLALPMGALAESAPSEWAEELIDTSAAAFLTAESGEIDYAADITREQFAVMTLYLYNAVSTDGMPQMTVENPFVDCNNPLVAVAYGMGLVQGVTENTFEPDASITREALCTMIARLAAMWTDTESDLPELDDFSDADEVSDWAVDAVKFCVKAGLIQGTDLGEIDPEANCTVEQALIIAKRMRNMGV
ncbi:MAG: S-layer homology domain-containing protein [Clostridia bacterium]|nr:S-layer homology domain-containing protein [Clostridia bacterium]